LSETIYIEKKEVKFELSSKITEKSVKDEESDFSSSDSSDESSTKIEPSPKKLPDRDKPPEKILVSKV
jgi:hypothetical protein